MTRGGRHAVQPAGGSSDGRDVVRGICRHGIWSSVTGGYQNNADGELTAIVAGEGNTTDSADNYSAILSGSFNTLAGSCTSIPFYQEAC